MSENIQIIPANPGFYTLVDFEDNKEIVKDQPIIAWRMETTLAKGNHGTFTTVYPLTTEGDAVSNCIGILNPDNTVSTMDAVYQSLDDFQNDRYPNK